MAGVRPVATDSDPYAGFAGQNPLFVEREAADGTREMVTADNKLSWFNAQSFPFQKPPGTARIFCLGGSTTYGRPYDDQTSFCGWLREFLQEASQSRRFEVINAGGISYASFRVATLMQELTQYEPDLFIVYTGHNEFLERRTYARIVKTPRLVREIGAWASQTSTFALLHGLVHAGAAGNDENADGRFELPAEVETQLDRGVGPDAYHRDDPLHGQVTEHFRVNLGRMVKIARDAGARIVFVAPASNLSECSPFKSEHQAGLSRESQAEFQRLLDEAKTSLQSGNAKQAQDLVKSVLSIDDRYAHAHFVHGQALAKLGRHTDAKAAFERAIDEDVCPLRAISSIRHTLSGVARDADVPIVDFVEFAAGRSEHGIPGNNLFLDHVHPTIEGNRLLALEILSALQSQGIVSFGPSWNDSAIAEVVARVESRLDRKAHGNALRNLAKVLTWAGKHEEAHRLALKAADAAAGDAETHYLAANSLIANGNLDGAERQLANALQVDPDYAPAHASLGVVYQQRGQLDKAEQQYRRVISIDPNHAAAHNNLGALYERKNDLDAAVEQYRAAIGINPDYAKAYHNLGVAYRRKKDMPEAIANFRKAIEIDGGFAAAHNDLGAALMQTGDVVEAVFHFRQALSIQPGLARTANALAWILATDPDTKIRDGEEALRWALRCAAGTEYREPVVLNTLAACYAKLGDFTNAVKWQRKALELAPDAMKPGCQERLELYQSGRPLRIKHGQ